jgi:uncharacterized membrane protein YkvA (DUF1232 family)
MSNKGKAVMVIVLTLVYLVSPVDFVPDFIPGVGQLDDLLALFFGGGQAVRLLKKA